MSTFAPKSLANPPVKFSAKASALSFLPVAISATSRIVSGILQFSNSPRMQLWPYLCLKDFSQLSEMLCKQFDRVVCVQKIFGAVLVVPFVNESGSFARESS